MNSGPLPTRIRFRRQYAWTIRSSVATTSAPRELVRTSIPGDTGVQLSTVVSTLSFRPSNRWSDGSPSTSSHWQPQRQHDPRGASLRTWIRR
jgi:hypothetical protein